MKFLQGYTALMKKQGKSKKRITPQEIDAELLKFAASDPNITVDAMYVTNEGIAKGHKFTVTGGPVITTRYDDVGQENGSVLEIPPESPKLNEGQPVKRFEGGNKPRLGS